jgi:TfoX/Sxy family transcriptional regulator of competence genes
VAYDEELADRIRELVAAADNVREKKMFGGLAFLVDGHLAVSASGRGGIMVRVDPARAQHLEATTAAYPMEMRGRTMSGWLRVDAEQVRTQRQLKAWVDRGVRYAGSLPAKRPRPRSA